MDINICICKHTLAHMYTLRIISKRIYPLLQNERIQVTTPAPLVYMALPLALEAWLVFGCPMLWSQLAFLSMLCRDEIDEFRIVTNFYPCIYEYMYTCINIYVLYNTYICVHLYTYIYIHKHIKICIHTYTYIYIYIYVHVYVCI